MVLTAPIASRSAEKEDKVKYYIREDAICCTKGESDTSLNCFVSFLKQETVFLNTWALNPETLLPLPCAQVSRGAAAGMCFRG